MALAVTYKGLFTSADGYAYQAWLWQEGFAGSASSVILSGDPCSVSWGKDGSDIYAPMLGSKVKVTGWRITDELESLIGARTGDWLLEIVRGASQHAIDTGVYERYWLGQVLADVYEDSTMTGPSTVDVQAVDGIGTLKEVPYYQISGSERLPYEGRASYLTILRTALGKLGYDLPIRSALAWQPDGNSGDILANLQVDQLSFYDRDGKAMSCYAVIEEIARRFGARFFQYEGAWWIVARELQNGSAFTVYQYDDAGASEGTTTAGTGADAGAAGVLKLSGKRSFRPAWSSVTVIQNHGPIPPLVDEGEFSGLSGGIHAISYKKKGKWRTTTVPSFTSGSWTYAGGAYGKEIKAEAYERRTSAGNTTTVATRNFGHAVPSYFHGSSDNPVEIKQIVATGSVEGPHYAERVGNAVEAGQIITFTGKVTIQAIDYGPSPYMTYFSLVIEGTDYYLKADGSWGQSSDVATQVQFITPPGQNYDSQGIPMDSAVPFTFVSEAAPAQGAIRLRLYGSTDVTSGTLNPGDTVWDDVAVLVTDTSGEVLGSIRTDVFTPRPDPARDEIEVITGEGPPQTLPTTITLSGVKATGWTSALLVTAHELNQIHAETILRMQSEPLEVRQETYRNLAVSPVAPLKVGDVAYPAQELTLSLYHNEASGEFVEYAWDSGLSPSTEGGGADGPGVTYTPRPGPGQPDASWTTDSDGGDSEVVEGCWQILTGSTSIPSGQQSVDVYLMDPMPMLDINDPDAKIIITPHWGWDAYGVTDWEWYFLSGYSFQVVANPAPSQNWPFSYVIETPTHNPGCDPACWRRNMWYSKLPAQNGDCAPFEPIDTFQVVWPTARGYYNDAFYLIEGNYVDPGTGEIWAKIWKYNKPVLDPDSLGLSGNEWEGFDLSRLVEEEHVQMVSFGAATFDPSSGYFYSIGSSDGEGNTKFYRIHAETRTWVQLADAPYDNFENGYMYFYQGKVRIYAAQILDGGAHTEKPHDLVYDPDSDSWSEDSSSPYPAGEYCRSNPSILVHEGDVYVIGGADHDTVTIYNKVLCRSGGTWSVKADLPVGMREPNVCSLNGRIHIMGYHTAPAQGNTVNTEHYVYDPDAGVEVALSSNLAKHLNTYGSVVIVQDDLAWMLPGRMKGGDPEGKWRYLQVYVPFDGARPVNPFTGEEAD